MIGWEDYTLHNIFRVEGFPLQRPDWRVICCNDLLYIFPTRRPNIVNFLIDFTFLTATYFSKARYSLFVPKVPLNPNQSMNYEADFCTALYVYGVKLQDDWSTFGVRTPQRRKFDVDDEADLLYGNSYKTPSRRRNRMIGSGGASRPLGDMARPSGGSLWAGWDTGQGDEARAAAGEGPSSEFDAEHPMKKYRRRKKKRERMGRRNNNRVRKEQVSETTTTITTTPRTTTSSSNQVHAVHYL